MVSQQSTVNTEQGNIIRQSTGRPVIRSTEGVISSGHYLTSMAGTRMLLNGGNAFDALVAAGFAAAVVEPIASLLPGRRGRVHALRRGQRRPAFPERTGDCARQSHRRILQVAGPGANPDRAGTPAVAPFLHPAGRRACIPFAG